MRPRLVVFDFDKTLAYFSGLRRVPDLLVEHGLDQSRAESLYEQVRAGGFSVVKLLERVPPTIKFDCSAFVADFDHWLRSELKLYDDAVEILGWLNQEKIPWAIVTFGDPAYQRRKIDLLGLKPTIIIYTSSVGFKAYPLAQLNEDYRAIITKGILRLGIVYIDDNEKELSSINDELPSIYRDYPTFNVRLFLIDRGHSVDQGPIVRTPDPYLTISSLLELKNHC